MDKVKLAREIARRTPPRFVNTTPKGRNIVTSGMPILTLAYRTRYAPEQLTVSELLEIELQRLARTWNE